MTPRLCLERFFTQGGDTPDSCCQLPRGHAGCHLTASSEPSEPEEHGIRYASRTRWGHFAYTPILDPEACP